MSRKTDLIQIRSRRAAVRSEWGFIQKICEGPIADKCFYIAALGSVFGTTYLGAQLWMSRMGAIPSPDNFAELRELHIFHQFFFLFGMAIMGFALQSAPRFLNSGKQLSPFLRMGSLIMLIFSWFSLIVVRHEQLGSILLSVPFLLVATALVGGMYRAHRVTPPLLLLVLSLTTFACGTSLPLADPTRAVTVFWLAVGAPVLGFSQIFISNLIGGKRLTKGDFVLFMSIFFATTSVAILHTITPSLITLRLFGLFSSLLLFWYVSRTQLFNSKPIRFPSLVWAFRFGYCWALCGALRITLQPSSVDAVFHIWATGWGFSLLLALTSHITGFLSGSDGYPNRALILVLLWQIVPFGRGCNDIFALPQVFSIIVSLTSLVVLGGWIALLTVSERRILLRQRHSDADHPMVMEG